MIGLDTNIVVRFLVDDDPAQSALARDLFASLSERVPGFIAREVLLETFWVLRRAYRFERNAACDALDGLLTSLEVVVEASEDAAVASGRRRAGEGDFADLMIVAANRRAGCTETVSFDSRTARIEGVRRLDAE